MSYDATPAPSVEIHCGDCRDALSLLVPEASVQTCVTSPPYYGLRDYGVAGQIGLEDTPEKYVANLVDVFRSVREVLADDGTIWVNLGDSYANDGKRGGETSGMQAYLGDANRKRVGREKRRTGLKPKDLIGIPWMVAFALRADGWYLRQDIIWHKPNPMPESVRDRCTKAHEYLFLLSKSERYYFDAEAIKTPASSSFANDRRHLTGGTDRNDKNGYDAAGAQNPKGPHRMYGNPKWKTPDGWDTSKGYGGHGSFHKDGREKGQTGYVSKSGNKERKPGSARGCPEGSGSNVCGSVPWWGVKANRRSVWTVTTKPFKGAHFATFPPDLITPCILAGSRPGDLVLDPFAGSGTTGMVARRHSRRAVLCELNPDYCAMAAQRVETGK